MKKFIIILGIILTSGLAALALSGNKNNEINAAAKAEKTQSAQPQAHEFGDQKNDISNVD
jgi:hypothetical protein